MCTTHASFAEGDNLAKRYAPEVVPLAATRDLSSASFRSLAQLLGPGGIAGIVLDAPPECSAGWNVIRTLRVAQMVWTRATAADIECTIEQLSSVDAAEMLALTRLTEPGPFGKRTHELGSYLGIRQGDRLVAMAGERLRPLGYAEVSGVCTHPEYQGRGYASTLVSSLIRRITERGEIPFLHVVEDNVPALRLYRRLGFETRRLVNIIVLKRDV